MASRAESIRRERQERQWPRNPVEKEFDRFFQNYGAFLAFWSNFDLLIEVAIMKQLKLSHRSTSIVCAGLGFGGKINILYSLLSRSWRNKAKITALLKAQTHAERNTFVHGFIFRHGDFNLVRREVRAKYTVRVKHLDSSAMGIHSHAFGTFFQAVQDAFKITNTDLSQYALSIRSDAKGYRLPVRRRRVSRTSSQKASRTRQPPPSQAGP